MRVANLSVLQVIATYFTDVATKPKFVKLWGSGLAEGQALSGCSGFPVCRVEERRPCLSVRE